MEEKKNKQQFILYPTTEHKISLNSALVYATLKRHKDKNNECYPSIERICELSKLSKNAVIAAIKELIDNDFITKRREKNLTVYKFPDEDRFEIFTYKFLDKEDLTPTEKGLIILLQRYMIKEAGSGNIWYSNEELSSLLNISVKTLRKYLNSFKNKKYLTMGKLVRKDGKLVDVKQFNLTELDQAIVFTLLEHGKDIDELKQRANKSDEIIDELTKRLEKLEKQERLRQRLEESSRLAEEELYRIRHGE